MRLRALAAAAALAAIAGCLSPGSPYYPVMDDKPPTVVSIDPPMGDTAGGDGGVPTLTVGQIITITFSEPMDLDSIRPGIAIRDAGREEIPLLIAIDPSQRKGPTAADLDVDWPVHVTAANGFVPGVYQLILRPLLIDQQGNALQVIEPDGSVSANGFVATFLVQ